jgi:hypothetical protein
MNIKVDAEKRIPAYVVFSTTELRAMLRKAQREDGVASFHTTVSLARDLYTKSGGFQISSTDLYDYARGEE